MEVAEKVMGVQEVVERVEAVKEVEMQVVQVEGDSGEVEGAVEIEVANMAVGGKVVV